MKKPADSVNCTCHPAAEWPAIAGARLDPAIVPTLRATGGSAHTLPGQLAASAQLNTIGSESLGYQNDIFPIQTLANPSPSPLALLGDNATDTNSTIAISALVAGAEYTRLVRNLSALAAAVLDDPEDSREISDTVGPGVAHVVVMAACLAKDGDADFSIVPWPALMRRKAWASTRQGAVLQVLQALVEAHILPRVRAQFFNEQDIQLTQAIISRNMLVATETVLTRELLWHWRASPADKQRARVLIYLTSAIDSWEGCLQVMANRSTGLPFAVRPLGYTYRANVIETRALWGEMLDPVSLPRPWHLELHQMGYEPHCVGGASGTAIVYDPSIVHRHSRPGPGVALDAALLEFEGPVSAKPVLAPGTKKPPSRRSRGRISKG